MPWRYTTVIGCSVAGANESVSPPIVFGVDALRPRVSPPSDVFCETTACFVAFGAAVLAAAGCAKIAPVITADTRQRTAARHMPRVNAIDIETPDVGGTHPPPKMDASHGGPNGAG